MQETLDELLSVLDTKISEFQSFIQREKGLEISVVKEFLDNTAKEFQEKLNNIAEATGLQSILGSVAENLKTKFEEFLNSHQG